jgi:hypothetical protein
VRGLILACAGVRPGAVFSGRGELAVVGLHCMMMAGIYANKETCFAICDSARYDNAATTSVLEYSGAGKVGAQLGRLLGAHAVSQ